MSAGNRRNLVTAGHCVSAQATISSIKPCSTSFKNVLFSMCAPVLIHGVSWIVVHGVECWPWYLCKLSYFEEEHAATLRFVFQGGVQSGYQVSQVSSQEQDSDSLSESTALTYRRHYSVIILSYWKKLFSLSEQDLFKCLTLTNSVQCADRGMTGVSTLYICHWSAGMLLSECAVLCGQMLCSLSSKFTWSLTAQGWLHLWGC